MSLLEGLVAAAPLTEDGVQETEHTLWLGERGAGGGGDVSGYCRARPRSPLGAVLPTPYAGPLPSSKAMPLSRGNPHLMTGQYSGTDARILASLWNSPR